MDLSAFEEPSPASVCFSSSMACFMQSGTTESRTSARVRRLEVAFRDCAKAGSCSLFATRGWGGGGGGGGA